jgi:hypothetical protein
MKIGILIEMLTTMDPNQDAVVHLATAAPPGQRFEIIAIFNADGEAHIEIAEETEDAR